MAGIRHTRFIGTGMGIKFRAHPSQFEKLLVGKISGNDNTTATLNEKQLSRQFKN
jgi:hypothetical protein